MHWAALGSTALRSAVTRGRLSTLYETINRSLAQPLAHALTPPTRSRTHPLATALTHLLTHPLAHSLTFQPYNEVPGSASSRYRNRHDNAGEQNQRTDVRARSYH